MNTVRLKQLQHTADQLHRSRIDSFRQFEAELEQQRDDPSRYYQTRLMGLQRYTERKRLDTITNTAVMGPDLPARLAVDAAQQFIRWLENLPAQPDWDRPRPFLPAPERDSMYYVRAAKRDSRERTQVLREMNGGTARWA